MRDDMFDDDDDAALQEKAAFEAKLASQQSPGVDPSNFRSNASHGRNARQRGPNESGGEPPRWALLNHQMVQIDPNGDEIIQDQYDQYDYADEDQMGNLHHLQGRYEEADGELGDEGPVFFQDGDVIAQGTAGTQNLRTFLKSRGTSGATFGLS